MGKKLKKILRSILVVLIVVSMIIPAGLVNQQQMAYAAASGKSSVPVLSSASYRYITAGESYDFNILNKISHSAYSWKSSNTKIATVTGSGEVTAKAPGTATITCDIKSGSNNYRLTAKVYVKSPENAAAKKVNIVNKVNSLLVGGKYNLNKSYDSSTAKDYINWTSSNTNVAAVDKNGFVTGIKDGIATITATTLYGKVKDNFLITVSTPLTVSDQNSLENALHSASAKSVLVKTDNPADFTIPAGDYLGKSIFVDAPNATVSNYGVFSDIQIHAIKTDTWHEYAKGNSIYVAADKSSIVIEDNASANINIIKLNSNIMLNIQGDANIAVEASGNVSITGTSGVVPNISLSYNEITVNTDLALNVTANVKATIDLNTAEAAKTIVKAASNDCIPVVMGDGSITVSVGNVTVIVDKNGESTATPTTAPTPTTGPAPTTGPLPTTAPTPTTEPSPTATPKPSPTTPPIYQDDQTYEAYPALKEVYQDYFTMGIFGSGEMNALVYNFAAFTPGNEMKPESTQNVKDKFTFTAADNTFSSLLSRNPDMQFLGHTLAWHSQTPVWMWDAPPATYGQPGTYDKDTALANLNNHIDNVLEHFGPSLQGIDVVNEAIQDANAGDWKAALAPQGCWYSALGWQWVEDAFLEAAKVVDSHPDWNVKLRYNDFGLDDPKKAQMVYNMVKDINENYADARPNGKPLIEVIGMQAHYGSSINTDNVENSIKLFSTLPGVMVNITESDVGAPPIGQLTPDNENNQAVKWAELFQIYKKYAAGPANTTDNPKVIDQVDICGVRDAANGGWRAGEYALLFDVNGLAKQALLAVLNPDGFLADHQYIDPDEGSAPEHIDGVYVYSTANGDDWTGANIILGSNEAQWPWSTAGDDGKAAFTPEKDATYRLSINYTSNGTSAVRVRWVKDNTNGGYTSADSSDVNKYQYSANQVATTIPAYFNSGMVGAGSYTLTDEFKMDGSQPADGLIGNIAIRGGGGGNAYTINWIKVEKVGTDGAADELLVNWPEGIQKPIPDGVHVYDAGGGDAFSGANIILGNDASQWPWSTAGDDGKAAFTPEKDAKYRLKLNYTSNGTSSIRVRWIKDDTNGGYTSADSSDVNKYTYSANQVATTIPAYFNSGMTSGKSYTLIDEFIMDGSQAADGLIGNIAIRGGGGGNAFSINWIKVEKIGTGGAPDELLVVWAKDGVDPDSEPSIDLYSEDFKSGLTGIVSSVSGAAISVTTLGDNQALRVDQTGDAYITVPLAVSGSAIAVSGTSITVSASVMYNDASEAPTGFEIGIIEDGIPVKLYTKAETTPGENNNTWITLTAAYTLTNKNTYLYIKGNHLTSYYVDNIKIR